MARWFVAATGRGTALKAYVYGPYASEQAFHNANRGYAGETFILVEDKNGYTSQAAANAAAAKYNTQGVTARVTQAGGNTSTSIANKIPNPLSGLSQIGADLTAFYKNITDGKMWRSLGWLALGIVLIISGLFLWMKDAGMIPSGMPIPIPV